MNASTAIERLVLCSEDPGYSGPQRRSIAVSIIKAGWYHVRMTVCVVSQSMQNTSRVKSLSFHLSSISLPLMHEKNRQICHQISGTYGYDRRGIRLCQNKEIVKEIYHQKEAAVRMIVEVFTSCRRRTSSKLCLTVTERRSQTNWSSSHCFSDLMKSAISSGRLTSSSSAGLGVGAAST